ncbi:MAG: hypothetical protein ABIN48_00070 [Ginsengibacter sp.]
MRGAGSRSAPQVGPVNVYNIFETICLQINLFPVSCLHEPSLNKEEPLSGASMPHSFRALRTCAIYELLAKETNPLIPQISGALPYFRFLGHILKLQVAPFLIQLFSQGTGSQRTIPTPHSCATQRCILLPTGGSY